MISTIGKCDLVISWVNKNIILMKENKIIYINEINYTTLYKIMNTLQELGRGVLGLPLKARPLGDWAVEVAPPITGVGWLMDPRLGKIVGSRCLNGMCIIAERRLSEELFYLDYKSYDVDVVARCAGLDLVELPP